MGFGNQQLDQRTRRLMASGNFALAIGLILFGFVHPAGAFERNCLHAVAGMLVGISIGINLFALRCARRCREKQV
jgi:hypothetical protein